MSEYLEKAREHLETITPPMLKSQFDDLKRRLSLYAERDYDNRIREQFTFGGKFENLSDKEYATVEALKPLSIISFPSKKGLKLLSDLGKENPDSLLYNSLLAYVQDWRPISEEMKRIKDNGIISAREKRQAEPSNTQMRTLENTGTCGICGKNVKMTKSGKLVDHGYRSWFRQGRYGNCFGVGYPPIEKSDEVLKAYLKHLEDIKAHLEERMNAILAGEEFTYETPEGRLLKISPDDPSYEKKKAYVLANTETGLKQVEKLIEETTGRIKEWKPRPLPGEK